MPQAVAQAVWSAASVSLLPLPMVTGTFTRLNPLFAGLAWVCSSFFQRRRVCETQASLATQSHHRVYSLVAGTDQHFSRNESSNRTAAGAGAELGVSPDPASSLGPQPACFHHSSPSSACSQATKPLTLAGTNLGDGNTAWISCTGNAQSVNTACTAPLRNESNAT